MSVSGDEICPLAADDDVVPTTVDFNGRPSVRSHSGCWKSASFILVVEVVERFVYYGISSNLVNYLTGPLGQSTSAAAAAVNAWTGTASLLPLLGGFIADTFLGRYRMIIVASLLYILGLGFLSVSATFFSSNHCEEDGNNRTCSVPWFHTMIFYVSLYLVALAQGGHMPCVAAFGADQFDKDHPTESIAKCSFFNWLFFAVCASAAVGILGLNYIEDNLSWGLSLGISSIVMCLGLLLYLLGTRTYRFPIPIDQINPFVRIGRVFISRNRTVKSKEIEQQQLLDHDEFEQTLSHRYLGDVEEGKAILRLLPIWFTCVGYAIPFSQTATFFNKQGVTMDRYIAPGFQIPAASLLAFISLTVVAFVPIYDRVLVPLTRAMTKKPSGLSVLQRIGTGIFLSFLCMVVAALVEQKRLAVADEYGLVDVKDATVPMNVWWLVPQYVLFGIADVFAIVGLQEFFYDQVSGELKSIGIAMYHSIIGIGGFLSSFLVSLIWKLSSHGHGGWLSDNLNRGHLDYFYWFLAGLSAVELAAYVYFARRYTYRRKIDI